MVKVIHFCTNRFLIYDFLYALNSNFCSKLRTHRLATIHNVTDAVVKFSRNSVPPPEIAVPPPKVVVPPPGNDVPSPIMGKSLKLLPPEVRF